MKRKKIMENLDFWLKYMKHKLINQRVLLQDFLEKQQLNKYKSKMTRKEDFLILLKIIVLKTNKISKEESIIITIMFKNKNKPSQQVQGLLKWMKMSQKILMIPMSKISVSCLKLEKNKRINNQKLIQFQYRVNKSLIRWISSNLILK